MVYWHACSAIDLRLPVATATAGYSKVTWHLRTSAEDAAEVTSDLKGAAAAKTCINMLLSTTAQELSLCLGIDAPQIILVTLNRGRLIPSMVGI